MQTSRCPICQSDVVVGDEVYKGDIETCANCGAIIEIISLRPLVFKKIEEETE